MRKVIFSMIILSLMTLVGCNNLSGPESVAYPAFEQWAQQNGIPFRDVNIEVIENDGTYATLHIIAWFRESQQSQWLENEAEIVCRNVGGMWQCDTTRINFILREEETEGMTAEDLLMATRLERLEVGERELNGIEEGIGHEESMTKAQLERLVEAGDENWVAWVIEYEGADWYRVLMDKSGGNFDEWIKGLAFYLGGQGDNVEGARSYLQGLLVRYDAGERDVFANILRPRYGDQVADLWLIEPSEAETEGLTDYEEWWMEYIYSAEVGNEPTPSPAEIELSAMYESYRRPRQFGGPGNFEMGVNEDELFLNLENIDNSFTLEFAASQGASWIFAVYADGFEYKVNMPVFNFWADKWNLTEQEIRDLEVNWLDYGQQRDQALGYLEWLNTKSRLGPQGEKIIAFYQEANKLFEVYSENGQRREALEGWLEQQSVIEITGFVFEAVVNPGLVN